MKINILIIFILSISSIFGQTYSNLKQRKGECGIELLSFEFLKHFCLKPLPESLPQLGKLCLNVTKRIVQNVLEAEIPQRGEMLDE